MKYVLTILFSLSLLCTQAQLTTDIELPFAEIPEYPEDYAAGNLVVRMIDGLGFRYYWATEGLTAEDLTYRPTPEASSHEETMHHIFELSVLILNAANNAPNDRSKYYPAQDYASTRSATLKNLEQARKALLNASSDQLDQSSMIFVTGDQTSEFPFWHLINGPLTDAIYHIGQLVSFRRTSGNPINSRVDVFRGRLRSAPRK